MTSLARVAALVPLLAAAGCGSADDPAASKPKEPKAAAATPATPEFTIPGGSGHLALMAPREGLTLRDRPNGRVIAHLGRKTRWGSATIVWAPDRRGDWLGVVATEIGNRRIGWINARKVRPRMWRSRLTLRADLSDRRVELHRGSKVVRTIAVTVGGPATPTPTGRFAVTDKLVPAGGDNTYGCCILALSGHQPVLRPGWAGGDRVALHGSPAQQTGAAASAGCLRATDRELERLMRTVPLGTPFVIRA